MDHSEWKIRLSDVTKQFGPLIVLNIPALEVMAGAIVALQGHSGGGKTTLLRLVAGLEQPSSGTVQTRLEPPDSKHPIGMVFQHPVLLPHVNVRDNLAMGWRLHYNQWSKFWWEKTEPSALRQRLDEAIQLLELAPLQQRLPSELSGGQRQRVALGRCLVRRPAVFLLDEPLANLDPALAQRLQARLHQAFRSWGSTVLWVTHDPAEADWADRRITLTEGQIRSDIRTNSERVQHERS
jgi:ABC-type sugar transport system ATPase subunit